MMRPVHDEPSAEVGSDDGGTDGPLFGRFDAAVLMAVENANGGEWAGLGQVIVTFDVVFGQSPDVDEFTESCQLLCEAGLIEYFDDGLALTPSGRKLLRRAGSRGGAKRPQAVTDLLAELDDGDLAAEGTVPAPERSEVAAAVQELTPEAVDGLERFQAANVNRLAPSTMPLGGLGMRPELVVPIVPPDDTTEEERPSET